MDARRGSDVRRRLALALLLCAALSSSACITPDALGQLRGLRAEDLISQPPIQSENDFPRGSVIAPSTCPAG